MWRSDRVAPAMILLLQALSDNRMNIELSTFTETEIRRAVIMGLGPSLFRSTNSDPRRLGSPLWPLVRASDLAAQVIAAEQTDALVEILDGSNSRLTLLKGISISHQHYPVRHLRPMRDIDVMVDEEAVGEVELLLKKLGYRQDPTLSSKFYETHHHSQPFFHPERGIWLEVHRRLFPKHTRLGRDNVFSPRNVSAQLVTSEFHGRRVNRLSDELQIAYIASHWAANFDVIGSVVAFLDTIFLLRNCNELNWSQILRWMDGSAACANLYLLLSYMAKYRLIDLGPGLLDELRCRQRTLNRVNLEILHKLIDSYVIAGKVFGRILSERNALIAWTALLSCRAESANLLLIPLFLLLPAGVRRRFQQ